MEKTQQEGYKQKLKNQKDAFFAIRKDKNSRWEE